MIELNPDGISIKGCKYIYPSRGQAGEYAPLTMNPYKGCGHKCTYCYVPLVLRATLAPGGTVAQARKVFDAGAVPRPNFLTNLRKDAQKYQSIGSTEQVFTTFTSDVFNPFDMSLTRPAIEILIEHGMGFCTLTKGGSRALAFMDLFRPTRDAFATTLTSLDDSFSRLWEPGAQLPGDRIATLKAFHEHGIFTWFSLEPTLSAEASLQIVQETHGFVDLYKVGKANYIKGFADKIDWRDYTLRMIDLLQKVGAKHYIKKDLQKYLPSGYYNPLRIQQHN